VTRSDISLALSTGQPYPVVARLDDRVKATMWDLLEDAEDARKDANRG
jgi:hypothetical protein